VIEPVHILSTEPPKACSLEWLPLAVRFKLDAVGLKIRLSEWQALTKAERQALLACPPGERFDELLLCLVPHARRIPYSGRSYAEYLLAKVPLESAGPVLMSV
jgi:hypothetical protein